MKLPEYELITFTWGNVSERDPDSNYFVIKPSGVDYDELKPSDMVVVDLDGNVVEGTLRPSSDTPTHAYLYKQYPDLKGICHTHSMYATTWAQTGIGIPSLGTTHADNFYGDIPCTPPLDMGAIKADYEHHTGVMIAATLTKKKISWQQIPAILVSNHGPFTFGDSGMASVKTAKVLETIAQMAWQTYLINGVKNRVTQELLDKHYFRKHGKKAYYGQN